MEAAEPVDGIRSLIDPCPSFSMRKHFRWWHSWLANLCTRGTSGNNCVVQPRQSLVAAPPIASNRGRPCRSARRQGTQIIPRVASTAAYFTSESDARSVSRSMSSLATLAVSRFGMPLRCSSPTSVTGSSDNFKDFKDLIFEIDLRCRSAV